MSLLKNNLYKILFTLVLLLGFILRFYDLGKIPAGLYQDETAIGYNAYSILKTGKDEYGKPFPLYFKSFGDYKLPVYIYLDTIPIKFLGLTETAVRLPSAVFGFLTIPVFYFLFLELLKNKKISLFATLLLAVNPWHLFYNRATFEVSISLFLFSLGTLFLLYSFRKKSFGFFLVGTLGFVLGLYTYNLTRLLAPLLYLFIIFLNKNELKNINRKEIITTLFISVVLLIPFAETFLKAGGSGSAAGTLIFSSATTQAQVLQFKTFLINLPSFLSGSVFNSNLLTLNEYIKNIISYFSTTFYFVSGDPHGNHGLGNFGQLYLFEFPLVILGFIKILKGKVLNSQFFLGWGIITILVASLTRAEVYDNIGVFAPQATRSFFLIFPLIFLSTLGFFYFSELVNRTKNSYLRYLVFVIAFIITVFNISYYLANYYLRFPILYAKNWNEPDKYLSLYLNDENFQYRNVVFDNKSNFNYSNFLFYSKFPPEEFQKTVKRAPDDSEGFSKVLSFGKYEFKDIDWNKDYSPGANNIIITSVDQKPTNILPVRAFYLPERTAVFPVGQKVVSEPVQEQEYVVIESN